MTVCQHLVLIISFVYCFMFALLYMHLFVSYFFVKDQSDMSHCKVAVVAAALK